MIPAVQEVEQKPAERQRRKRRTRNGKFPFQYINNIETDQINQEEYIYS